LDVTQGLYDFQGQWRPSRQPFKPAGGMPRKLAVMAVQGRLHGSGFWLLAARAALQLVGIE